MVSQTESWAEDSDSSADGEDALLGGGRVTYRPPRLCRIVSVSRVRSLKAFQAERAQGQGESEPGREDGGGALALGGDGGAVEADWVNVSRRIGCCTAGKQPELHEPPRHDHMWVHWTERIEAVEEIFVSRKRF